MFLLKNLIPSDIMWKNKTVFFAFTVYQNMKKWLQWKDIMVLFIKHVSSLNALICCQGQKMAQVCYSQTSQHVCCQGQKMAQICYSQTSQHVYQILISCYLW
jgi:hypothetical protein